MVFFRLTLQEPANKKYCCHVFSNVMVFVCLLLIINVANSEEDVVDERPVARHVVLEGVLGTKALLSIDGQRQMLAEGKKSKDGDIQVLKITSDFVDALIDGKKRRLRLGDSHSVTRDFKKRKSVTVIIPRSSNGMYSTIGSINGLTIRFLIDTGATTIAMNANHAKRLAINYRVIGNPTVVGTASGVTKAYQVTLDKVTVGEISMQNVTAVVIDGQFPAQVLLGMSFLGQLEIQREGAIMKLKKKL